MGNEQEKHPELWFIGNVFKFSNVNKAYDNKDVAYALRFKTQLTDRISPQEYEQRILFLIIAFQKGSRQIAVKVIITFLRKVVMHSLNWQVKSDICLHYEFFTYSTHFLHIRNSKKVFHSKLNVHGNSRRRFRRISKYRLLQEGVTSRSILSGIIGNWGVHSDNGSLCCWYKVPLCQFHRIHSQWYLVKDESKLHW